MGVIKKNYIVKKTNVMNELRATNMTLQELRFFCIYLSKINPNDTGTRVVRFPIEDFKAIMELGRINIDYMKTVTNGLLSKIVNMPNERGGYTGFQLFKKCRVDMNDDGEWYIEIDAHDEALPLMFEFKDKYFSYQLWNALRLKSANQLRMYEILKQYEKVGVRILSVEELRNLIGIHKKEYKAYKDFRIRVLDACQQALSENTDIEFTYEPHGKKGQGGKIMCLKFTIQKNEHFVDQLSLDDFINAKKHEKKGTDIDMAVDQMPPTMFTERLQFLSEACNNEFSENEMIVLNDLLAEHLPGATFTDDKACYDYLMRRYNQMIMRNDTKKILHRFSYMKTLIKTDI